MNAFSYGGLAAPSEVQVDVYTAAYRISGTVTTPFARVADILNQLPAGHITIDRATISEHADPAGTMAAPSALVALEEIVVMVADGLQGDSRADMRIEKRPVRALLAIPPFRAIGMVHVPIGSRPVDGLLNAHDRFLPMTEVTLSSAAYSQLDRSSAVVAIRRDRAHILLVTDDERPDQLLSDVLDQQTAERWLRQSADEG
jgi:hypothetical protein